LSTWSGVVEYDMVDHDGKGTGEPIVLPTGILDPAQARADTYHPR
jgi:hypothetical protein